MKRIAMLWLIGGALVAGACDRTSMEEAPGDGRTSAAELDPELAAALQPEPEGSPRLGLGAGLETGPAIQASLLCLPRPPMMMSAPGGANAFRTGAFWMFDVPCGISDISALRNLITVCLTQNNCGVPYGIDAMRFLFKPFELGQGQLARVGSIPVELFSQNGRTRVLLAAHQDPLAVLGALRGTGLPPGLPCTPLSCPKGAAAGSGLDSAAGSALDGAAGSALDEAITGIPCCPGCGGCTNGQCEPRPSISPRAQGASGYECNCEEVCRQRDSLPEDCYCKTRCSCTP